MSKSKETAIENYEPQEQVIIPQSTKEDKPKVDKWMTEKQFEELKQKTKAEIKKYLGIYNGTTPYTDGHIYGMKKQYKALTVVGRWKKGDIVGDLSDDQIKQLVAERVIEEIKPQTKAVKEDAK